MALGQLAAAKGSKDSLKALGRQVADEQRAANAKLKTLAAKSGVTLPTGLSADGAAMQTQLESLSGSAFDQAYVETHRKLHNQATQLLEMEISSGTDAGAKAWATDALPMLKRHAELVGGLDARPGEHDVEHATRSSGPADAPPPK